MNKRNILASFENKKLKGVTILEMVVYIALFGIIMSTIMSFALSLQESQRKASQDTSVEQNAMFIFQHLSSSIDKTTLIDTTQSTLNNNNGKLHLALTSGVGDYSLSSNQLVYNNGTTTSSITLPNIAVSQFRIEPRYYSGTQLVGINVTLVLNGKTFDTTFTIK